MEVHVVVLGAFMAFPTRISLSNMRIRLVAKRVHLKNTIRYLIYIIPLTTCYFVFSDINNNS